MTQIKYLTQNISANVNNYTFTDDAIMNNCSIKVVTIPPNVFFTNYYQNGNQLHLEFDNRNTSFQIRAEVSTINDFEVTNAGDSDDAFPSADGGYILNVASNAYNQAQFATVRANAAYNQALIATTSAGNATTLAFSSYALAQNAYNRANEAYNRIPNVNIDVNKNYVDQRDNLLYNYTMNVAYTLSNDIYNVAQNAENANNTGLAAWIRANSAMYHADNAWDTANNAYNWANAAYDRANEAYNHGGGGGGVSIFPAFTYGGLFPEPVINTYLVEQFYYWDSETTTSMYSNFPVVYNGSIYNINFNFNLMNDPNVIYNEEDDVYNGYVILWYENNNVQYGCINEEDESWWENHQTEEGVNTFTVLGDFWSWYDEETNEPYHYGNLNGYNYFLDNYLENRFASSDVRDLAEAAWIRANEAFQYGNNRKNQVGAAIIAKQGTWSSSYDWNNTVNAIYNIPQNGGGGGLPITEFGYYTFSVNLQGPYTGTIRNLPQSHAYVFNVGSNNVVVGLMNVYSPDNVLIKKATSSAGITSNYARPYIGGFNIPGYFNMGTAYFTYLNQGLPIDRITLNITSVETPGVYNFNVRFIS